MEAINLHRYIVTQSYTGKYYIITLAVANLKFIKVRYNLYRIYFDSPIENTPEIAKVVWKLDKRSIRYVEGIEVIENTPEEAKEWKHLRE